MPQDLHRPPAVAAAPGLSLLRVALRALAAAAFTGMLVLFMVLARLFDDQPPPDREIRRLEKLETIALPAPPPPPLDPVAESEPPPPPAAPQELPRLEIDLEMSAPPVAATLGRRLDLTMKLADFSIEPDPTVTVAVANAKPNPVPVPKARAATGKAPAPSPAKPPAATPKPVLKQSYTAGELDARPRLINRPAAAFPAGLLKKGVREGRVTLEVAISPGGGVSVRRVISTSHPDFAAMARSFAARSRFTVPRKNGQPVTAIYQWPLILKP